MCREEPRKQQYGGCSVTIHSLCGSNADAAQAALEAGNLGLEHFSSLCSQLELACDVHSIATLCFSAQKRAKRGKRNARALLKHTRKASLLLAELPPSSRVVVEKAFSRAKYGWEDLCTQFYGSRGNTICLPLIPTHEVFAALIKATEAAAVREISRPGPREVTRPLKEFTYVLYKFWTDTIGRPFVDDFVGEYIIGDHPDVPTVIPKNDCSRFCYAAMTHLVEPTLTGEECRYVMRATTRKHKRHVRMSE